MEKLKEMKECLIGVVENQIYGNLDKVDAKELGEVVDMIKDLAEAIYYCTITDAMEADKYEDKMYAKTMPKYRMPYYDDNYDLKHRGKPPHEPMDIRYTSGYVPTDRRYTDNWKTPVKDGEWETHGMIRDPGEGRSGQRRKMYMEGKNVKDKSHQMRELESYMQELSQDVTEMIQDASPEEKQLLQQKISTLATKIK